MKTIKVTGPHILFSPVSSFYTELQELATRDSTNDISPQDRDWETKMCGPVTLIVFIEEGFIILFQKLTCFS